jgi:tagaturonate reductase
MTVPSPGARHRVLQFGTGRFLRGFVDAFLDEENAGASTAPPETERWKVSVVESSGSGAAARLRSQGCRYRLMIRGVANGQRVDRWREIDVIDASIDATHEPEALLEAALDPAIAFLVSNTTEAGYLPERLPARLSALLEARARARLPGVTILPCELIEANGRKLRDLVLADARKRGVASDLIDHVEHANLWAVTLVDRITSAPAPDDTMAQGDPFAVVVEPYASWVVEAPADARLPAHPAVQRTSDVLPFALRKIRILNGGHTALVSRTRNEPISFVREAMETSEIADWLEGLLAEEIVPALGDRIVDGAGFVRVVLERFRNPFQDHRLRDIEVGHREKLAVRLLPTYHDYVARFGRRPQRLGAIMDAEGMAP